MTGSEILKITREEFLSDDVEPYLWPDSYLLRVANEVERDAARRARLIQEKTLATADDVYTGTATSTSTDNLVDSGKTFVSATVLGKTVYNTTDDTFATVTSFGSGTSLGLSGDIMASGDSYIIGDPAKALNRVCVVDGTHSYALSQKVIKISTCYLASDGLPLTQVTEGEMDELDLYWRVSEGTPVYYLESKGLIRLIPIPDETFNASTGKDTLFVECFRLPLEDFTMAGTSSPEIPEEYHFGLIDGICEIAYGKNDADTFDSAKRNFHAAAFTEKFGLPTSAKTEGVIRMLTTNFKLKSGRW